MKQEIRSLLFAFALWFALLALNFESQAQENQHILAGFTKGLILINFELAYSATNKHPWASFKPGSWASYRKADLQGEPHEVLARFKLISVGATNVVVEAEVDTGKDVLKEEFNNSIPKQGKLTNNRTAEETIKINDKELKCRVLIWDDYPMKIWTCDEVPGLVVKVEKEKYVINLIDFKVK